MDTSHFFTASRVLIVAGKGGVGKSAVATALALSAARAGLTSLLIDLDTPSIEAPAHDLLSRRTISPGRALTDYLSSHGLGLVSRQLARSGIVELVASTAPGLDDLLVLGQIKALERDVRADLIVVDGPAAGHALDLLRAPRQLQRAIPSGPIRHQADEVLAMLADLHRCRTVLVTTPAHTPIQEMLDAARDLRNDVGVALAPCIVNMRDPAPRDIDDNSLDGYLKDGYRYARAREKTQHDALALLDAHRDDVSPPLGYLTLHRHRSSGADLVNELANDITTALASQTSTSTHTEDGRR